MSQNPNSSDTPTPPLQPAMPQRTPSDLEPLPSAQIPPQYSSAQMAMQPVGGMAPLPPQQSGPPPPPGQPPQSGAAAAVQFAQASAPRPPAFGQPMQPMYANYPPGPPGFPAGPPPPRGFPPSGVPGSFPPPHMQHPMPPPGHPQNMRPMPPPPPGGNFSVPPGMPMAPQGQPGPPGFPPGFPGHPMPGGPMPPGMAPPGMGPPGMGGPTRMPAPPPPVPIRAPPPPQPPSDLRASWKSAKADSGHVYYYNSITNEKTWHKPEGFQEEAKAQPLGWENIGDGPWQKVQLEGGKHYYYNKDTKESSWEEPIEEMFEIPDEDEADPMQQFIEAGPPPAQHVEEDEGSGEDEDLTLEDRKAIFRKMLIEREVATNSTWEKQLPKIVFDPRYKILPQQALRRRVYDHYVKHRADEERSEKKMQKEESLKVLQPIFSSEDFLEQVTGATEADDIPALLGRKSDAAKAWSKMEKKDRSALLNPIVQPLKEAAEAKRLAELEGKKKDFLQLLKDCRAIDGGTRWSTAKKELRGEKRYEAMDDSTEVREAVFEEYVREVKKASDEARRQREQDEKQKAREEELQRRRDEEEKEARSKLRKQQLERALGAFDTMLVREVKDPSMRWRDASKLIGAQLEYGAEALSDRDREDHFRRHTRKLQERLERDLSALIKAAEPLSFEATWDDVRLKAETAGGGEDPRVEAIVEGLGEEAQRFVEKHLQLEIDEARRRFFRLMRDTSLLQDEPHSTGKGYAAIISVLEEDERYGRLDSVPEKRESWLQEGIEEAKQAKKERQKRNARRKRSRSGRRESRSRSRDGRRDSRDKEERGRDKERRRHEERGRRERRRDEDDDDDAETGRGDDRSEQDERKQPSSKADDSDDKEERKASSKDQKRKAKPSSKSEKASKKRKTSKKDKSSSSSSSDEESAKKDASSSSSDSD